MIIMTVKKECSEIVSRLYQQLFTDARFNIVYFWMTRINCVAFLLSSSSYRHSIVGLRFSLD